MIRSRRAEQKKTESPSSGSGSVKDRRKKKEKRLHLESLGNGFQGRKRDNGTVRVRTKKKTQPVNERSLVMMGGRDTIGNYPIDKGALGTLRRRKKE